MATNNNVLVNNLCAWPLSFWRKAGQGDVEIPANAKNWPLLSFEEVQAQIQTGNRMFTGTDGTMLVFRLSMMSNVSSFSAWKVWRQTLLLC